MNTGANRRTAFLLVDLYYLLRFTEHIGFLVVTLNSTPSVYCRSVTRRTKLFPRLFWSKNWVTSVTWQRLTWQSWRKIRISFPTLAAKCYSPDSGWELWLWTPSGGRYKNRLHSLVGWVGVRKSGYACRTAAKEDFSSDGFCWILATTANNYKSDFKKRFCVKFSFTKKGHCSSHVKLRHVVFLEGIHFALTVPLSTQVYKWIPTNLMLGGETFWWTSIPSTVASCYRTREKLWPDRPLASRRLFLLCVILILALDANFQQI